MGVPKSRKEVQAFMGFMNFYHHCIKDISKLATLLTDTTSEQFKDKNWQWSHLSKKAFEALKQRFTTVPVLRHYDPILPIIVEMDAGDFAIRVVRSQKEDRVQPVAFYSRKMIAIELNYDIHDKEMLAIGSSFKEWRRYLEGAE
jgi:HAMP domain-containing protein